ncbi:hypothetical protein C8A05DRAFT_32702 [Staphylotrichum tortipilum]|uniref:Uncharacterized protein n=1 Tax=Staphylotrichum tortipilum TaxID=2831512 RepID=A0AAN6MMC1_9PEZI|nr:hypothetical protein C8A05DRAFT_32702 [Staphylotrichum longicolle]
MVHARGASRPRLHDGCQFYHCALVDCYPEPLPGCFCPTTHEAFSSACRCWAPPSGLFRVCRALGEDAGLVFFSGNRFVVMDGPGLDTVLGPPPGTGDCYAYPRLAAIQFLRDVVPARCLGHIRFLELVFPPYTDGCWPWSGNPILDDWNETIRWLEGKANAAALVVRVVAPYVRCYDQTGIVLEVAQAQEIMGAYLDVASPLVSSCDDKGEGGRARFYVQLTWRMRRTQRIQRQLAHRDHYQETLAMVEREESGLKEMMERWVLGHEGYSRQSATVTEPERGRGRCAWICITLGAPPSR